MKLFENLELEKYSDFEGNSKLDLDKNDKSIASNFDTLEDLLEEPIGILELKDILNSKLTNKKFEFDMSNTDESSIVLQKKNGEEKQLTIELESNRLNVYSIIYKNDTKIPIFSCEKEKIKELITFLNKFINNHQIIGK